MPENSAIRCAIHALGIIAIGALLSCGESPTQPTAATLKELSPTWGERGTTVTITLTGVNFRHDAMVRISGTGVAVENVRLLSDSSLGADVTVAAGAELGPHDVTVTTAGATTAAQTFVVTAHEDVTAYVANSYSDDVSVIDGSSGTVTGSIDVGDFPVSVAFTPDGSAAYVANNFSHSISVIDVARGAVVDTIDVGSDPNGVAFTPDGTTAYVATTTGASVIDVASGTITGTIDVQDTVGSAASEPRSTATSTMSGGLIAFAPDGFTAYVASGALKVSIVNVLTGNIIGAIDVGDRPGSIALARDGSRLYVTTLSLGGVSVIDTATGTVSSTIDVEDEPSSVAFTPDGSTAYVANLGSDDVSVIDVTTGTVTGTISAGSGPTSVAFTPDGATAYVVDLGSNNVSVIDVATGTLAGTIRVGDFPQSVAIKSGS